MSLNILLINCYIIGLLLSGVPTYSYVIIRTKFQFSFHRQVAPAIARIWSQSPCVAGILRELTQCEALHLHLHFAVRKLVKMWLFLHFCDFIGGAQLWHFCTILCRFNCCAGARKTQGSFCEKYPHR